MESFTLEPLDTAALQRQHQEKAGRGKRKRRLVIDEPKNISGDEIKANLSNYKYISLLLIGSPPQFPAFKGHYRPYGYGSTDEADYEDERERRSGQDTQSTWMFFCYSQPANIAGIVASNHSLLVEICF